MVKSVPPRSHKIAILLGFSALLFACSDAKPPVAAAKPPAAVAEPEYRRSANEDYELQERCGKRAEEWFTREWGRTGRVDTPDATTIPSYENHYNRRFNKCFVLLTVSSIPKNQRKSDNSESKSLFDINEQKDYGEYFEFSKATEPSMCWVQESNCKSRASWEALAAPYMAD